MIIWLPAPTRRIIPTGGHAEPDADVRRFRPDIEGLRAVALGLVLLYHAGITLVPAGFIGVDVFFVISGFLITRQLVGELHRSGTISLHRFYARRARRLLPASAVVVVATVLLTWALVPKHEWRDVGGDVISSALYSVNWRLAQRSVDYLTENVAASPAQHFWSLSVEEQYYLLWPLLLLVAAALARRRRTRLSAALCVGLAAVAVPSLVFSVVYTMSSPASAFFVTTTRLWELGVGAGTALACVRAAALPRVVARPLGWLGMVAIAGAALLFDARTPPWPGAAALVPTLGAAAVILAGPAAGRRGPVALLGQRPVVSVGGLSYSVYLWHWPLLAAVTAHLGGLSGKIGLLLVAAAFVPAWLSRRLVEDPVRYSAALSPPWRGLGVGLLCVAVGCSAGLALRLSVPAPSPTVGPDGRPPLGATALREPAKDDPAGLPVDHVDWLTPGPIYADEDYPDSTSCQQNRVSDVPITCTFGDPDGTRTVAVVGDSKVNQWMSALEPLAVERHWKLVTFTKSGCALAAVMIPDTSQGNAPYTSCARWDDNVLSTLLQSVKPDMVITSQATGAAIHAGQPDSTARGEQLMINALRQTWATLTAAGIEVVVLTDNPAADQGEDVAGCVADHPDQLSQCAFPRASGERNSAADVQLAAVAGQPRVTLIDLSDAICPTRLCAPVIGNVLVYRQGSHLTATYVRTLTTRLGRALPADF